MASTIRIKRSSVAGKTPNTSILSTGELALNLADKKLYSSNGTSVFELGSDSFQTKSDAVSSNNSLLSLINDRLQVANLQPQLDKYLQVANASSIGSSSYGTINVDGVASLVAGSSNTVLNIRSTGGIVLSGSAANNTLTIDGNVSNSVSYSLPTKLDGIVTSASASYSLKLANSAYTPVSANSLLVSLNGVIQEPGSAFNVSGSTLTFSETLNANDTIDFVTDLSTTLTTRALIVNEFADNLIPSVTDTYTVGTISKQWQHVYTTDLTAVNINSTSDKALKLNIKNADSSDHIIDNIKVRQFDWKNDQTHQNYGLVAQELEEIMPEAVGTSDQYMTIDYVKLVPVLIKQIQELKNRIELLENK